VVKCAFVTTLLLCATASSWAQSAPQSPPVERKIDVDIEFATSELPRQIGLLTAMGETANRGADIALDKLIGARKGSDPSGITLRLVRLWFVNLPIAALTTASSHNAGHFARMNEVERGEHVLHITHWPWPVPLVGTVEWGITQFDTPLQEIAVVGGGEQGSSVLKNRIVDKIYASDRADYFDWILVGYASLDFPMYAWTDLRPSHFSSLDTFFNSPRADFSNYVMIQSEIDGRADVRVLSKYASEIRRSAWLNLADFALWSAIARTARYVAAGERTTNNAALTIGRYRIVPGAYASLATLGLERGIDVRIIGGSYLTQVNVRRTSSTPGGEQWGLGLGIRPRLNARLKPEGQFDVWGRPGNHPGLRFEAGVRGPLRAGSQPFTTAFRIGYKTKGYLADAPYRATMLASISTTIRF
jgi:hypothetical protein